MKLLKSKNLLLCIALMTPFLGCAQVKVMLGKIKKHTNIETSYPYWSPDEKQIVFQSNRNDDDTEIYTMNADGTGIKRLTFSKGYDETPIWSPDGNSILFTSYRDGNTEIYLMDTDVDENDPWNRELSARLYSGDGDMRLRQEMLLGIGGVRALRKLGYDPGV